MVVMVGRVMVVMDGRVMCVLVYDDDGQSLDPAADRQHIITTTPPSSSGQSTGPRVHTQRVVVVVVFVCVLQLRKRRPTPATLFLLNDQTSPDDDRDGEHGEGAEGRLGHSPRKGGHHSSYTPPTMSQMQTLVELHLHATEEEDEEDLDDDEDDRSAGGEDDNGASGGDGHHASLILHVPPGAVAPHGEKGGARGGLHGDAGEPTPGTTAEPEAGSPPSGGAQGDFVAASGGGYGEGKEPGNAEEVANVTFEPRRRVTWAHGPGEAAGGPPSPGLPPRSPQGACVSPVCRWLL
ncbi:uncharacterized protein LOC144736699 isoform X2 [Lampetra planeri]